MSEMSEILTVKNFKTLQALPNHSEGEVAYCEEEEKYYIYKDEWIEIEFKKDPNKGIELNLYDLNKQIISQLPPFEDLQWAGAEKVFADWDESSNHKYYLLYGREIGYFTLFKKNNKNGEFNSLFEALKSCLNDIGDIYAFDITEDKSAIEIWVKYEDNMTVLYLFNYDTGVVTFNE